MKVTNLKLMSSYEGWFVSVFRVTLTLSIKAFSLMKIALMDFIVTLRINEFVLMTLSESN